MVRKVSVWKLFAPQVGMKRLQNI